MLGNVSQESCDERYGRLDGKIDALQQTVSDNHLEVMVAITERNAKDQGKADGFARSLSVIGLITAICKWVF
jgi:hypothetical protein